MNNDRLLRIANRINLLLLRELSQGIDVKRLLASPLYARDVLLVCDALPGSDLASLAQHFRVASVEPMDEHGHPSTFGTDSSGFGASRSAPDSAFGTPLPAPRPARSWFSPGRWLAR
jgi:hypothetical protein